MGVNSQHEKMQESFLEAKDIINQIFTTMKAPDDWKINHMTFDELTSALYRILGIWDSKYDDSITVTPDDLLENVTAYDKSMSKITGNIPIVPSYTHIPGTEDKVIIESKHYVDGEQILAGCPNLKPENIRKGVNMFGVVGTMEQSEGTEIPELDPSTATDEDIMQATFAYDDQLEKVNGKLKDGRDKISDGTPKRADNRDLYISPNNKAVYNNNSELTVQLTDIGRLLNIDPSKIESGYKILGIEGTKPIPNEDTDGDGKPDINIPVSKEDAEWVDEDTVRPEDKNNPIYLNEDTDNDKEPEINIDTDNDGKPDLNIDTDKDRKPDVNIDTDDDGEPDLNIDTDGDYKPDLDIDTNGDGEPDVNVDTDNDGEPELNIDTDGDGKPDINIDTDGDGQPDINIDTDGDGQPDINIDTNGDGQPDLNIDTNNDGEPDLNIDTNGDGMPDINIDTNNDGQPDLNIDTDGDGQPNLNIDTDGDGNPDVNIDTDNDGDPDINIDTDGDGIPDINIDTNNDNEPDINIDTDNDGQPDLNIDTDGDGQPDLNIDTNNDGDPDLNIDTNNDGLPDVNIDTDGDGEPDINIDTNDDNIPDLNIDTNGDGLPDINIDTNDDGEPDLNIDTNGDNIPDTNIDTNNDGQPDLNIDTNNDGEPDLNIDTNGDGQPDVNIDTNNDGQPDVNIDTNNDGKPDVNIDANGDGVADTNLDTNNDGEADTNINDHLYDLNQDTDGDGNPDLNIDTNNDGEPDLNIDNNGDGEPDLNIDTDGDGNPDLNIDTDGDGKPDLNIDTDGDGNPDLNIDTDGDGEPDLNVDTNKDGQPDLNIDTNNDGSPDINIDNNNDGKPDVNIDTNHDGQPDLNIDTDNDGQPDLNIDNNRDGQPDLNIDTDNDGNPDTNIDTNNDGRPDLNIDTDHDGSPDTNIDNNNDGSPDVNIDNNRDGQPDINIDNDHDGVPDTNIDTNGDGYPDTNIDTNHDGTPDTNIDTDGDGQPDLNIDNNRDGEPDVNIDTDGDGYPNTNIDTNNDGRPDANIDTDNDGDPDINVSRDGSYEPAINIDNDKDGKADTNIDTDGDGYPNTNIDNNNDGKPDINIDTNHDGTPDLNIDTNNDGRPDLNIDTNHDGRPDLNIDTDGDGHPDVNVDNDGDGIADTNIDTNHDGTPDRNLDSDHDGIPDKEQEGKPTDPNDFTNADYDVDSKDKHMEITDDDIIDSIISDEDVIPNRYDETDHEENNNPSFEDENHNGYQFEDEDHNDVLEVEDEEGNKHYVPNPTLQWAYCDYYLPMIYPTTRLHMPEKYATPIQLTKEQTKVYSVLTECLVIDARINYWHAMEWPRPGECFINKTYEETVEYLKNYTIVSIKNKYDQESLCSRYSGNLWIKSASGSDLEWDDSSSGPYIYLNTSDGKLYRSNGYDECAPIWEKKNTREQRSVTESVPVGQINTIHSDEINAAMVPLVRYAITQESRAKMYHYGNDTYLDNNALATNIQQELPDLQAQIGSAGSAGTNALPPNGVYDKYMGPWKNPQGTPNTIPIESESDAYQTFPNGECEEKPDYVYFQHNNYLEDALKLYKRLGKVFEKNGEVNSYTYNNLDGGTLTESPKANIEGSSLLQVYVADLKLDEYQCSYIWRAAFHDYADYLPVFKGPLFTTTVINDTIYEDKIELVPHVYARDISEVTTVNSDFSDKPKQIIEFTPDTDFNGKFELTMNTGHWYWFKIFDKEALESDPNTEPLFVGGELAGESATHDDYTPQTFSANVQLQAGKTYIVQTKECQWGGTDASRFVYSFNLKNSSNQQSNLQVQYIVNVRERKKVPKTITRRIVEHMYLSYYPEDFRQECFQDIEDTFQDLTHYVEEYVGINYKEHHVGNIFERSASYTYEEKKKIAKCIHDYLIVNNVYEVTDPMNQTLYPAMSRGKRHPVCASYATAFKYCCSRYGIVCHLTLGICNPGGEHTDSFGGRHMWNRVNYEPYTFTERQYLHNDGRISSQDRSLTHVISNLITKYDDENRSHYSKDGSLNPDKLFFKDPSFEGNDVNVTFIQSHKQYDKNSWTDVDVTWDDYSEYGGDSIGNTNHIDWSYFNVNSSFMKTPNAGERLYTKAYMTNTNIQCYANLPGQDSHQDQYVSGKQDRYTGSTVYGW